MFFAGEFRRMPNKIEYRQAVERQPTAFGATHVEEVRMLHALGDMSSG